MFTVLLGKPNRLFYQNRSQDSTLISVLLNAVLTVSLIFLFFFLKVRDIQILDLGLGVRVRVSVRV